MHTTDDYYAASPERRKQMRATHRGEPRAWAIAGYHAAMQQLRKPTHRGAPRNA